MKNAEAYYIEFDTNAIPGKLRAVKVALDSEIISDMDKGLRVDLALHPLYPALEKYVLANPSPKGSPETGSKH